MKGLALFPNGVSIVGIGQVPEWRGGSTPQNMGMRAIAIAAKDAGIDLKDVDGILPYVPGVTAEEVASAFGIRELNFVAFVPSGGAAPIASLQLAKLALESGMCRYVVAFMVTTQRSKLNSFRAHPGIPGQQFRTQLEQPYGWSRPAHWYAMMCRRHMHEFGTTKEHLAKVAMIMRENAQRNPDAMMYGRELTMAQYFDAPTIADPYQKFDCCLETDGAAAVILTTTERAGDLERPTVEIAGIAQGHPESADDICGRADWFSIGLSSAAPRAFAMAGIAPSDVDAAMIYDCFTFEVIQQLEEAGFCQRGEGQVLIDRGDIASSGRLPVNTHGGLLSEGHIAGMNHLVEAVRQLRGECGERQLTDPKHIAVTGWGDLGDGSMAVLRKVGAA